MNFNQLAALFEAKGTKPGERYFNAKNQAGPAGIASSPVGKDSFNPELRTNDNRDPKDQGIANIVDVIRILSKGLMLLKNDDVFEDQMRGIMNGFKKNRNQISAYQESVLKTKPKLIDNLWGEINRLTKILNNPSFSDVGRDKQGNVTSVGSAGKTTKDRESFLADLNKTIASKDEHEAELNAVYDAVDEVTGRNEELNNEYLEQLLTTVKHTTNRLFKRLSDEINEEAGPAHKMQPISLEDLDWNMLEKEVNKNALAQLQLLEMLMSDDSEKNPLVRFMEVQEENYNEARDRYYQLRRGDNYSVSTDQLYNNLPLFKFVNFLSHVILKAPKIALTTKQKKMAKGAEEGDGMMARLGNISNERQFDEIKPELLNYIDGLELDETQKNALRSLANGKFVVRKGAPNAAFKIRSSLKSSQITESFDDYAARIIQSARFDIDDYKLNMIEVFA